MADARERDHAAPGVVVNVTRAERPAKDARHNGPSYGSQKRQEENEQKHSAHTGPRELTIDNGIHYTLESRVVTYIRGLAHE